MHSSVEKTVPIGPTLLDMSKTILKLVNVVVGIEKRVSELEKKTPSRGMNG